LKIIGSAEKRQRQSEKRRMRNKVIKSAVRTSIRKYSDAVKENNKEVAEATLKVLVREMDKAVTKGVLHRNTVARKKSRMYKLLTKIEG